MKALIPIWMVSVAMGAGAGPLGRVKGEGPAGETLAWREEGVSSCSDSGAHWDLGSFTADFQPDGTGSLDAVLDWGATILCFGTSTYTWKLVSPPLREVRPGYRGIVFQCGYEEGGRPTPAGLFAQSPFLQTGQNRVTCQCGSSLFWDPRYKLCVAKQPQVVVGFFNGVWNTEEQAQDGLTAIEKVVGPTHGGTQIRYEKFYNQTGRATGNTEAQDIAETFIQRSNELDGVLANRWEHYWELLSGRHRTEGSLTERLLSGPREGATALSNLIESAVSSMLAGSSRASPGC